MTKEPNSQISSSPWRKAQLIHKQKPRFDKSRKQAFLEWFATTCNVRFAARQVGVSQSTVYRNRISDPDFAEAWDRALDQGYVRLETELLEMQFEAVEHPLEFDAGFDSETEFPDQKLVDPERAIALLRQHRANSSRGRASRPAGGRLASDEEVRLALAKSLRAFGVRLTAADMAGDEEAPPPSARRSPSPGNPGEEN